MSAIRVVLCDIGGVLVHSDQTFTVSALVWSGVPYDLAKNYFNRPEYLELARGKISLGKFWVGLDEEYGEDQVGALTLQRAHKHHVIEADHDMIDLFSSLDAHLMLATDTVKPEFERYKELFDVARFGVWRSDVAGMLKRDPCAMASIFKWVQSPIRGELYPSEVLFIDDSLENCQAAAAYGFTSSRFVSAQMLKRELEAWGLL